MMLAILVGLTDGALAADSVDVVTTELGKRKCVRSHVEEGGS